MQSILHYPQKRIVNTKFCEYFLNLNRMPSWRKSNCCNDDIWYMEDAIIINESAIQRGMFNLTYYKNIAGKWRWK
jgi:hypothetical protein